MVKKTSKTSRECILTNYIWFRPLPATFHLTKIMKITKNIDFSKFDKSAGIGRNDDFCLEMCSLSPEEHICTNSRPYISICTFFRNFKKSIDFSPKKHRGKNEIGRFWLVKGSKQYHNYVGRSNILSCFFPIMVDVWLISFISIYDILYFVKSTKITHK